MPQLLSLLVGLPRIPATVGLTARRFLVAVMARDERGARRHALHDGFDWNLAEALALRFGLLPVLASRMEELGLASLAPSETRARLEEHLLAIIAQNGLLYGDATRLAEKLEAQKIAHVFLKGTALLALAEPHPVPRQIDDIDLLIHPADRRAAGEILRALGYQIHTHDDRYPLHPIGLLSPNGTLLDLHLEMSDHPELESAIWAHTRKRGLTIPSTADLVRHLCYHAVIQHEHRPKYLPRHLIDLQSFDDYREGREASRAFRLSETLLALLHAAPADPAAELGLAVLLFPEHHTILPLVVRKNLRERPSAELFSLHTLKKLSGYLLQPVD